MNQIDRDVKLLPIAKVPGRGEFLIDIENRILKDFNEPENIIKMHSSIGRQLISEMQNREWNCMGLSTRIDKGIEV